MATQESCPTCHVCTLLPASAGGLGCGHGFCKDCFRRYISGSINELNVSARCCICGEITDLVREISNDTCVLSYGRAGPTKFVRPVGIARHDNGDYIIADAATKRIHIHNINGRERKDFAYTYNTEPVGGLDVTSSGEIALPTRDNNYDSVSYYTVSGSFVGSAYIRAKGKRPDIKGIVCDTIRDVLYLTDSSNACIHVINNETKQQTGRVDLLPVQYETTPRPHAIALDHNGDLIITDTANHCVKIISTSGEFRQKIGCHGDRPGQFKEPTGVTITSQNEIVVADRGNQRVQILDSCGSFKKYIVRFQAGYDVYMAPDDVIMSSYGEITVLMTSIREADVGEVRIYKA